MSIAKFDKSLVLMLLPPLPNVTEFIAIRKNNCFFFLIKISEVRPFNILDLSRVWAACANLIGYFGATELSIPQKSENTS